ncbi:DUF6228 family protein [Nocardia camponoti]|uniref:DUF6228 family protein n=1 Tax=Nocardia camponoti TaxID=1616106 RepID=UPI00166E1352|nr:DUF6228 family protein [Nocardia camponoti]
MANETPDDAALAFRCANNPSAQVRFDSRIFTSIEYFGTDEVHVDVALTGDGLNATCGALLFSPWERAEICDYFDRLVADFAGWSGQRDWGNSNLRVTATFTPGGHVRLDWTVIATLTRPTWQARLSTWVEAGEKMSHMAADIRSFLSPTPHL